MSTTSTMEKELLRAARSGQDLNEIMRQYGRNKGPFYQALAKATAVIQRELSDLSRSFVEVQRGPIRCPAVVAPTLAVSLTENGTTGAIGLSL